MVRKRSFQRKARRFISGLKDAEDAKGRKTERGGVKIYVFSTAGFVCIKIQLLYRITRGVTYFLEGRFRNAHTTARNSARDHRCSSGVCRGKSCAGKERSTVGRLRGRDAGPDVPADPDLGYL
jgi:hypothetical protein